MLIVSKPGLFSWTFRTYSIFQVLNVLFPLHFISWACLKQLFSRFSIIFLDRFKFFNVILVYFLVFLDLCHQLSACLFFKVPWLFTSESLLDFLVPHWNHCILIILIFSFCGLAGSLICMFALFFMVSVRKWVLVLILKRFVSLNDLFFYFSCLADFSAQFVPWLWRHCFKFLIIWRLNFLFELIVILLNVRPSLSVCLVDFDLLDFVMGFNAIVWMLSRVSWWNQRIPTIEKTAFPWFMVIELVIVALRGELDCFSVFWELFFDPIGDILIFFVFGCFNFASTGLLSWGIFIGFLEVATLHF